MTYVYDANETEEEVYAPEAIIDPLAVKLIGVAQEIYTTYYQAHGEKAMVPFGVVVDRKTFRGQLIFTGQPILLPQESFIPIEQISYPVESDEYWE